MLAKDIANEPEEQFIKLPISMEQFNAMPRFSIPFFQFGINFLNSSIINTRFEHHIPKDGINLFSKYDAYQAKDGLFLMEFLCPKEYYMFADIYDKNNEVMDYRSFVTYESYSEELFKVKFAVSVPDKGIYRVNVRAKNYSGKETSRRVYEFYCKEGKKGNDYLPEKDIFYPQMRLEKYDVFLSDFKKPNGENTYYSFTVNYN